MLEVKESKPAASRDSDVLGKMSTQDHEQVVFGFDEATGLRTIIAIHNTVLGPALGGTRMWAYVNEAEALNDVLRLSRGMTYKAAITGLNLGGGKAVIIGDSRKDKTEALMRRFGKFVNSLGGKYITAEDVGISTRDMEYVKMETDYVTGIPETMGGSGDPSPVTAYGVYMGMKAAARLRFGSDSLQGKKVLVQGVGHVGEYLVRHLTEEGAQVMISDIYEDRIRHVVDTYKAKPIATDDVYVQEMDIYAPCALGATLNDTTLEQLKCSIVAGAANNQLADEKRHGEMIMKKGMLYAPDFLINAGGLINVYAELEGYNRERAMERAENIYNTTYDILKISQDQNIPSYQAANRMAEQRIAAIGKVKVSY